LFVLVYKRKYLKLINNHIWATFPCIVEEMRKYIDLKI